MYCKLWAYLCEPELNCPFDVKLFFREERITVKRELRSRNVQDFPYIYLIYGDVNVIVASFLCMIIDQAWGAWYLLIRTRRDLSFYLLKVKTRSIRACAVLPCLNCWGGGGGVHYMSALSFVVLNWLLHKISSLCYLHLYDSSRLFMILLGNLSIFFH